MARTFHNRDKLAGGVVSCKRYFNTFDAMDTLPLDRTGNRRFMPVMIYPERADCHILEYEKSSRSISSKSGQKQWSFTEIQM